MSFFNVECSLSFLEALDISLISICFYLCDSHFIVTLIHRYDALIKNIK